jgi:hypothetical protein
VSAIHSPTAGGARAASSAKPTSGSSPMTFCGWEGVRSHHHLAPTLPSPFTLARPQAPSRNAEYI